MKIALCAQEVGVPPRNGRDVMTVHLAEALIRRGHEVHVLAWRVDAVEEPGFPVVQLSDDGSTAGFKLKNWAARYPPLTAGQASSLRRTLEQGGYDASILSGGIGLRMTTEARSTARVWSAGDEMVLMRAAYFRPGSNEYAPLLGVKLALLDWFNEFIHRNDAEEVWVVSEKDRRWMQRTQLHSRVVNIPNGVDLDYFQQVEVGVKPKRVAFWGVLDFTPNLQALEWFVPNVFEPLRAEDPEAELLLIGRRPTEWVRRLTDKPGILLREDVKDLRPEVCSAPIAVFPFVSGSGIKNKLLEGAAMSRALVGAPRAVDGLYPSDAKAWETCRTPDEWMRTIRELWADPARAADLGEAARRWVEAHYHWDRAARQAEESLVRAIARRGA